MNRQLIVAAPDGTRVTIVVPPGLAPGQMMQIQLPNATPPAQQQALLEVMVPAGMSPGQRMRIQVPTTGQMMDVVIPPNVWPGMKMQVGAPAAPQRPLPVAQPSSSSMQRPLPVAQPSSSSMQPPPQQPEPEEPARPALAAKLVPIIMATKLTAALDLERKQAGTDLLSRLSGAISPSQEPEEQQMTPRGQAGAYEGGLDEKGRRAGHGKIRYEDGSHFEGGFANGEKEGLGVMYYADGASHEGEYKRGVRSGAGCYRFADGSCQLCHFERDRPKGHVLKWSAARGETWLLELSSTPNGMVRQMDVMWKVDRPEALQISASYGYGMPPKAPTAFKDGGKAKSISALIAEARQRAETAAAERAKKAVESGAFKKMKKRGESFVDRVAVNKDGSAAPAAAPSPEEAEEGRDKSSKQLDEDGKVKSLEKTLYRKFEKTGKRPKGSACHECSAFCLILSLVVVPAAVITALPQGFLSCRLSDRLDKAGLETSASIATLGSNCTEVMLREVEMPSLDTSSSTATTTNTTATIDCDSLTGTDKIECRAREAGNQAYSLAVNLSNYAFAVAWPLTWVGLITIALIGRGIDRRYRKDEHEMMRMRWEGCATMMWGFGNLIFYTLIVIIIALIVAKDAVKDFVLLIVKGTLGGLVATVAWMCCCQTKSTRTKYGTPTLYEVYTVKLDDKFQERTEGKRKYDKREDKKALKSILTMLTCGKWQPKKAMIIKERQADDEELDNLSPEMIITGKRGSHRSTYIGRVNAAGEKEGYGVEDFSDGNQYEGEYKNGKRDGAGTVLYKSGRAQVSNFKNDKPVGDYVVWNAGRVKCWRVADGDVLMYPITMAEGAKLAGDLGLPMPPIHADESIVEQEAAADFVKANPLPFASRVQTYAYCLFLTLIFTMLLRIMALMWFIVRSMASLPLYGFVPRLFYLEWIVHFHQKRIIGGLDYSAWRPLSPVLAPFFFCVYLPKMGIHLPGIQLAGIDWPDIDWPDIEWPKLKLPRVSLPDLGMLLKLRFPHVNWPAFPEGNLPGPFRFPSLNLNVALGELKFKYPSLAFPNLPGVDMPFPDWNLPDIDMPSLIGQLRVNFPDLSWPDIDIDLPSLPDFTLGDMLGVFKFKFPDLEWPSLAITPPVLPNLNLFLKVRFPNASWPNLPDVSLPGLGKLPHIDLSMVLGKLRIQFPHIDWPDLGGGVVAFPNWTFPGISFPNLFKQLQLEFPNLNWPSLPELSLPNWTLPEFSLPDLINLFSLRFPSLRWPDFQLPEFSGISLPSLGLGLWDLPDLRIPDLNLSIKAFSLSLPSITFPAIDFEMPDLSGVDIRLPNFEFPNIPIPSLGFPEVDFDEMGCNCGPACLTGIALAFIIEIIRDFKDFLLIFGKAHLLMNKVLLRKQRSRANEVYSAAKVKVETEKRQMTRRPPRRSQGDLRA